MLNDKGLTLLLFTFLFVVLINALLASFTKIFYRDKSSGHLSHSQLRIKQGNATFEHRLNVFAQSLVFCFVTFRIYLFTFLTWLTFSGLLHLSKIIEK
jgi:hypothetical protein